MTRRLNFAILLLLFSATSAWAKWDKEDKAYMVGEFRALQDQIQALKTQLDSMGAQINELKQNNAQLQAAVIRQQRALQDLEQLVSSQRLAAEDNFSGVKTTLTQLQSDLKKGFGQQAEATRFEQTPAQRQTPSGLPITPPGVQGYITNVEGNNVATDLGSAHGLRQGSRLAVYKASDPNTRVGVLEVTQVSGSGESRARIVTMNPGVRPEFSDIVRLE